MRSDPNPPVLNRLCDRADEQNAAVSFFYVDFAVREERLSTICLINETDWAGLERTSDEIRGTFQDHKTVTGGRGLRVTEIPKMLHTATPPQRSFI